MDDYELEIFRKLFKSVDVSTPSCVRRWFDKYPDMTIGEQCSVMDKSLSEIYRIRKLCGINSVVVAISDDGRLIKKCHKPVSRTTRIPEARLEWDESKIISLYCSGHSMRRLSRMFNCSFDKIKHFLVINNIELRDHKSSTLSSNAFCNRRWLVENYIDNRRSLRSCAKMAGVSHCTIRSWLSRFGISMRSIKELGRKNALLDQTLV